MEEVAADRSLPEGFGYEWTGTTYQEQKTGNLAIYIFALSIVCVFLFMAALYESWIRPLVIILTVPLATFGAIVGLWLFDMPLDVFGQIGLVMLIGLETKNAILIVEFGVELMEKQGMSIIDSAKEAVAAAAAADPDDLVRLHHGRSADGPGHRRRGLQPQLAGHRHRLRACSSARSWAGSSSRSTTCWASGSSPISRRPSGNPASLTIVSKPRSRRSAAFPDPPLAPPGFFISPMNPLPAVTSLLARNKLPDAGNVAYGPLRHYESLP